MEELSVFKDKNFVYFVMKRDNPGGFSLTSYKDELGEIKGIQIGQERNSGQPVFKRFKWEAGKRILKINKNLKNEIEHLENSPFCEGGPFIPEGSEGAVYKKVDLEKEANDFVTRIKKKAEAFNAALKLNEGELKSAAHLIGKYTGSKEMNLGSVCAYAETNPDEFLQAIAAPNFKAKALVLYAKYLNIIQTDGNIHYLRTEDGGLTHIGDNLSSTINSVYENENIRKTIEDTIDKADGIKVKKKNG